MEDFSKYENIQIEEVCRICLLNKENMSSISEAGLVDMLFECASIQVSPANGLFSLVCSHCANEVNRWSAFKQRVIMSFEIGRLLLKKRDKERKQLDASSLHVLHQKTNIETVIESNCLNQNLSKCNENMLETAKVLKNVLYENIKNIPQNISFRSHDYINENDHSVSNLSTPNQDISCSKVKSLQCKICNRQCSSTNSYNRHIKTHDLSRPYICSKCEKSFKTSQVLSEHLKRHYDDRRHICMLCGQKFYAKACLKDHMRSHTGEKPFKCNICEKAFGTKAILRQHQIVHTVREKRYHCDICNKFLLTMGSLETHKRKHSGMKPFPCAACEKRFFTKDSMQRHFGAIHDTDNNFLCNVCSKVCSTKVHLNIHMKKKHLGLGKPLNAMCSECGKQCGSTAELTVHMRVHTGERPYACDICEKRFIAKGNLNSHKHRHTGNKPHLCNHCGKSFAEKSTLKVHERIHTGEQPFKCNICGKSYVQSSALRTHLKTH